MVGPKVDRPTAAGETEPRAVRAWMADSQLEPKSQEMLGRKNVHFYHSRRSLGGTTSILVSVKIRPSRNSMM